MFLCLKYFFHFRDAGGEDEEFPKKLQEKLAVFKDMYPDRIVSVGSKRAFMGSTGSLNFELQATPYVKDTWHELPTVDSSSEEGKTQVSNWMIRAEKDGFPKVVQTGTTNVVPKDISGGKAKEMLPTGIKVSFAREDKAYESFLASPPLVKGGEMLIEGPFVRGPTHIKVKTDKNTVKTEKFARRPKRKPWGHFYAADAVQ